jgi:putative flavoprotein involved in K+ transport
VSVVVVGAGQAGLATSRELTKAGVDHVVLERGRVAQTWRGRWDSFCLVTPNWFVRLPDGHYDGPDPDGYMPRDEIVAWFERYASAGGAPVREDVDVQSVESSADGFVLGTSDGPLDAKTVVLATGAYQRPHRPAAADTLPPSSSRSTSSATGNEAALPPGRVLVVGSGQSGCQIAEELHLAGRDVVLACGRAPWTPPALGRPRLHLVGSTRRVPRRDSRVAARPRRAALRERPDVGPRRRSRPARADAAGTGRRRSRATSSGRRTAACSSPTTSPRASPGATSGTCSSASSCGPSWPSEGWAIPASTTRNPSKPRRRSRSTLADFGAAIFAGGFRPDYRSWLPWQDAFDEHGFPIHRDGASTVVPGLYFVGVHFLRKRKSSLLGGVGEDAEIVARQIAAA